MVVRQVGERQYGHAGSHVREHGTGLNESSRTIERRSIGRRGRAVTKWGTKLQFASLVVFALMLIMVQVVSAVSYYKLLGVQKSCSAIDLKKAYRKLALEHHPDKGGDEERFKRISEAYEVLSDPESRRTYDMFGDSGVSGGGEDPYGYADSYDDDDGGGTAYQSYDSTQGFDLREFKKFFEKEFGEGSFPQEAFRKGKERGWFSSFDLVDVLRSFFLGRRHQRRSSRRQAKSKPDPSPPPPKPKIITYNITCTLEELALGTTKRIRVSFSTEERKVYKIEVQPGWKAGTKIKFHATTSKATGRKLPAIIFVIDQVPHPDFKRVGNDLHYTHWIVGRRWWHRRVQIQIDLPTGEMYITKLRKRDARSGKAMVVPDKGMPIKGGPNRGNLVVRFRVCLDKKK